VQWIYFDASALVALPAETLQRIKNITNYSLSIRFILNSL